ncbi:hypothetical protein IF2G_08052 [Cordyceps javanica]|nr:hypothetical protein IF2G_08052 [Cordyceps javanica]
MGANKDTAPRQAVASSWIARLSGKEGSVYSKGDKIVEFNKSEARRGGKSQEIGVRLALTNCKHDLKSFSFPFFKSLFQPFTITRGIKICVTGFVEDEKLSCVRLQDAIARASLVAPPSLLACGFICQDASNRAGLTDCSMSIKKKSRSVNNVAWLLGCPLPWNRMESTPLGHEGGMKAAHRHNDPGERERNGIKEKNKLTIRVCGDGVPRPRVPEARRIARRFSYSLSSLSDFYQPKSTLALLRRGLVLDQRRRPKPATTHTSKQASRQAGRQARIDAGPPESRCNQVSTRLLVPFVLCAAARSHDPKAKVGCCKFQQPLQRRSLSAALLLGRQRETKRRTLDWLALALPGLKPGNPFENRKSLVDVWCSCPPLAQWTLFRAFRLLCWSLTGTLHLLFYLPSPL